MQGILYMVADWFPCLQSPLGTPHTQSVAPARPGLVDFKSREELAGAALLQSPNDAVLICTSEASGRRMAVVVRHCWVWCVLAGRQLRVHVNLGVSTAWRCTGLVESGTCRRLQ